MDLGKNLTDQIDTLLTQIIAICSENSSHSMRLFLLWPWEGIRVEEEEIASALWESAAQIRKRAAEILKQKMYISLLWIGPSDHTLWSQYFDLKTLKLPLLNLGEIGEVLSNIASFPRRTLIQEIILTARP